MDDLTHSFITKKHSPNKPNHTNGKAIENMVLIFLIKNNIKNPITRPLYSTQNQSQEQNYSQQL